MLGVDVVRYDYLILVTLVNELADALDPLAIGWHAESFVELVIGALGSEQVQLQIRSHLTKLEEILVRHQRSYNIIFL